MKVYKLYDGIQKKEVMVEKISKELNILPSEMCYIGDDVNDVEILKKVGLAIVPNDAIDLTKKISKIITKTNSGKGVLREVVDLILSIKFSSRENFY